MNLKPYLESVNNFPTIPLELDQRLVSSSDLGDPRGFKVVFIVYAIILLFIGSMYLFHDPNQRGRMEEMTSPIKTIRNELEK